jgi:tetratricopeptide (TPR) repeat protein
MFSCFRRCFRLAPALLLALLLQAATAPLSAEENRLREQIIRSPRDAQAHERLAEWLLERLRADWARQDPNVSGASFQAQAADFERRARELLFLYGKVQALQTPRAETLLQLAEIQYLYLGQPQEAEKHLREAVQLAPNNPKVIIAQADFICFHHGKRAEGLALLRTALAQQPGQQDLLITLSDLLSTPPATPADYAEAKTLLTQALEKAPAADTLRLMLGRVWGREATRDELKIDKVGLEGALKLFQAVTQAAPENALAWLEQARAAQQLGRYREAEQALRRQLALTPADPQGRLLLGDTLLILAGQSLDQEQYSPEAAEADQWYQKLVSDNQLSDLALNQRVQLFYNQGLLARIEATTLARQNAHWPRAEARYQAAIAAFEKAQAIFDQVNILNPALQRDLGRAWHGLGLLREQQQRHLEAVSMLQTACGLKLSESCDWLKKHP